MPKKRLDKETQAHLKKKLHEIFVAKGPGRVAEAFGEDDFLLNMSSRVNWGMIPTEEDLARMESIWKVEVK